MTSIAKERIVTEYFDRCPVCESNDIGVDTVEVEDDECWRDVWCNQCGFKWVEVFRFEFSLVNDEKYYIQDGDNVYVERNTLHTGRDNLVWDSELGVFLIAKPLGDLMCKGHPVEFEGNKPYIIIPFRDEEED